MRARLVARMRIFPGVLLALAICLAPARLWAASSDQAGPFRENPVEESALAGALRAASETSDYLEVAIGLSGEESASIPVRVSEYSAEDWSLMRRPARTWSCVVRSEEHWQAAAQFLVDKAEHLLEAADSVVGGEYAVKAKVFLYQFPRPRRLDLGGVVLQLSPKAQRYLTMDQASRYSASRRVLILQEPHYELDRQYALFKGLEVLFADNPELLQPGRTVFLAEGYPAGSTLSVEPLVTARPRPSDALIRHVLSTYLIPGYVAYEWKHQRGIPIVGIEDPKLYEISARFWSDLQYGKDDGRSTLWPYTVAARNDSVVSTLLAQLDRYQCPILFVGGLHLTPLKGAADLRDQDWDRFRDIAGAAGLDSLKQSQRRGVAGLLGDRSIGYYLISSRGDPIPDQAVRDRETARYARLFRAQLDGRMEGYIRSFTEGASGVTVTPLPEAAAQVALSSSGEGEQSGEQEGEEDHDGDGGPPWKPRLKSCLDALARTFGLTEFVQRGLQKARELLRYIREHARQPEGYEGGGPFENRPSADSGQVRLPPAGEYREYDVNPKAGGDRGTERIVVDWSSGRPGRAWYTPDHYHHFYPVE